MKKVVEVWKNGVRVSRTETDDAPVEEVNLRVAAAQALIDLQTIQTSPLTTEAAQIAAIKRQAEILEALIKFIKRRIE